MDIEKRKESLKKTMRSFNLIHSYQDMLKMYKWFSLACSVHDEELTKKLMKEIIREGIEA